MMRKPKSGGVPILMVPLSVDAAKITSRSVAWRRISMSKVIPRRSSCGMSSRSNETSSATTYLTESTQSSLLPVSTVIWTRGSARTLDMVSNLLCQAPRPNLVTRRIARHRSIRADLVHDVRDVLVAFVVCHLSLPHIGRPSCHVDAVLENRIDHVIERIKLVRD